MTVNRATPKVPEDWKLLAQSEYHHVHRVAPGEEIEVIWHCMEPLKRGELRAFGPTDDVLLQYKFAKETIFNVISIWRLPDDGTAILFTMFTGK